MSKYYRIVGQTGKVQVHEVRGHAAYFSLKTVFWTVQIKTLRSWFNSLWFINFIVKWKGEGEGGDLIIFFLLKRGGEVIREGGLKEDLRQLFISSVRGMAVGILKAKNIKLC